MVKYYVGLPVTMEINVEVEADSAEEAIEKAFDVEWTLDPVGCEVYQCETHRQISRGNVCGAVLNEAYAQPAEDA